MNARTFDIPYIFSVKGIPKRGSKSRMCFFYEIAQVAIPDLAGDDAPVAGVFNGGVGHFGDQTYVGENGKVELRYHDGKLFSKVLTEYLGQMLDVTPNMIDTFLRKGQFAVDNSFRLDRIFPDQTGTLQRGLFPGPTDHYNPIKPFDEGYWSSFTSDDRDTKRKKTQALASDLLIIDGQFWKQVPEPRYLATYCHDDRGNFVSVIICDPTNTRRAYPGAFYGLTSWDRMARDILEQHGEVIDEYRKADVFIDEAFPYDDTLSKIVDKLAEAIAHDGDMLKDFDVRSMAAWASMRDAFRNARETGLGQSSLDDLAAAAEAYTACGNASDWAKSLVSEAFRLLDDRSVEMPNLNTLGTRPRL